MNNFKNQLIRFSVDAHRTPAEEMLAQREDHSLPLRLAMVGTYKALSVGVMRGLGNHIGGSYIGMGGEQLVFASGDGEILKLLIDSIGSTQSQATELSTSQQDLSDRAQSYLDGHWVETTFYPLKMPRLIGGYAVAAVQPEICPLKSFENPAEVSGYTSEAGFLGQLSAFVDRVKKLHLHTGMYPDLMGPGNLVLSGEPDGERLRVVDTLPETPEKLTHLMEDGITTRKQAHDAAIGAWERFSQASTEYYGSRVAVLH